MTSVIYNSASYSKRSQFSDISKESKQKVYWKEEMAISLLKNVRAWRSIALKSILRGELKEHEQHRKLYFEHYLFQSMIIKIHGNENLFFSFVTVGLNNITDNFLNLVNLCWSWYLKPPQTSFWMVLVFLQYVQRNY